MHQKCNQQMAHFVALGCIAISKWCVALLCIYCIALDCIAIRRVAAGGGGEWWEATNATELAVCGATHHNQKSFHTGGKGKDDQRIFWDSRLSVKILDGSESVLFALEFPHAEQFQASVCFLHDHSDIFPFDRFFQFCWIFHRNLLIHHLQLTLWNSHQCKHI